MRGGTKTSTCLEAHYCDKFNWVWCVEVMICRNLDVCMLFMLLFHREVCWSLSAIISLRASCPSSFWYVPWLPVIYHQTVFSRKAHERLVFWTLPYLRIAFCHPPLSKTTSVGRKILGYYHLFLSEVCRFGNVVFEL